MSSSPDSAETGKRYKRTGHRLQGRLAANTRRKGVGMILDGEDELLTPAEVAALLRVTSKTVTQWAKAGKISSIRTLGGHRRFRRHEIEDVMRRSQQRAVRVRTEPDPRDEYARIARMSLP